MSIKAPTKAPPYTHPPSQRVYGITVPDDKELKQYQHRIEEARKRGCAEVLLEVREDNPRARRLYLRHGFTEVGIRRGYYQPSGVDAVVMRKELAR